MVEEDADEHLEHFTVEFKRKLMRQDQLGIQTKTDAINKTEKAIFISFMVSYITTCIRFIHIYCFSVLKCIKLH